MLRIWGRTNSINVQKVLWCCGELGLPYERIDAGMQFGVNNTPEYKAMNPNGLVPTINDDGFILWESHAIVRYLARKHGTGALWPADARVAADADRWMEWYSTTLWQHVRTIFWNLVRNGLEAMPDGGLLRVRLSRREHDLVLCVEDEGRGIASEDQLRIFEPFHTGSRMGTGLGLAIIYRIVQEHQGDIRVRSIRGRGTAV
ncbi:MAG: ATP-binding protein, partial [Burkholderiales bacterium]